MNTSDSPSSLTEDACLQKPMSLIVVIATYKRPQMLERLLTSLERQSVGIPFSVLVADNDATHREGFMLVSRYSQNANAYPIEAIMEPNKGLCNVRNRLIAHALDHHQFTHLVMIDDDEWPGDTWLAELVRVQSSTKADVVAGPVISIFDTLPPEWISNSFLFQPEEREEGLSSMVWGSNNILITRDCLLASGPPWFDAEFNTTGGEDVDFFTRLAVDNRRFAWAPQAVVSESVPAERARLGWISRRGWRIGSTDVRIQLRHGRGWPNRVRMATRACLSLAVNVILLPVRCMNRRSRADGLYAVMKSAGRFYGFYGGTVREYK